MRLDDGTYRLLIYMAVALMVMAVALAVLQKYVASIISIFSALLLLSFLSESRG